MSLSDNRVVIIDTNHTTSGGFSSFYVNVPRSAISKAPKSIKLLDCNIAIPAGLFTRFISYEADCANNHIYVENVPRTVGIDIFLPQCTLTASPLALPATQISGVGISPIATNANLGAFLQSHLNYWCTPVPPVGTGITFTIQWTVVGWPNLYDNYFEIIGDTAFRIRFDTYDTAGYLFGFGKAGYNVLRDVYAPSPFYMGSPIGSPDYSTHNPFTDEKYIYLVSDLCFGTDVNISVMNNLIDSRGVLFAIPYSNGYFGESEITTFVDVESSRFAQMYKLGMTDLSIHFWLQFPTSMPIDNNYTTTWSARLLMSFVEASESALLIT